MNNRPTRLTKKAVADAAAQLAKSDHRLAKIYSQFGPPPLLSRTVSFGTFVHIILEQQVSVESAKATFDRLTAACDGDVSPQRVQFLGESRLRQMGFSRQKTRYTLQLADDCDSGAFLIRSLPKLDDESVREQIVARLGLGNWSADVFLMMALLRPDILPVGDLALVNGIKEIDEMDYESQDQIIARAEGWRPLRSVATRMVWQWYVHRRGRDIF